MKTDVSCCRTDFLILGMIDITGMNVLHKDIIPEERADIVNMNQENKE